MDKLLQALREKHFTGISFLNAKIIPLEGGNGKAGPQISLLGGTFHLLEGVFKQRPSGYTDLYVLRSGQLLQKRREASLWA